MFLNRLSTCSLLFIFFLVSCNNRSIYDRVLPIPSDGWQAKDKLAFEFPISDTSQAYDILFHVRNEQNYSYSNIWLFIEITAPNGYARRDTFEIMLADTKGRWYGKGIGNINSMLVPYKKEAKFPLRGLYKISLQHAMYDDVLTRVLDVGVCIVPHQ
jgi:gliding motility-associated lipoprotein GldH